MLAFVGCQVCTGCGDDVEIYKPQNPFLPLTSPENVLHNLALSYNLRDCEHFEDLLCEDFIFVFNQYDVDKYSGHVPGEGFWSCDDERTATCHMFDTSWAPEDPVYKADNIELYLQLSGSLVPTNFKGAPFGTLVGSVTLDLQIDAGGGALTLLVNSRPHFYFAPDHTQTPTLWCIWRCEDAPFDYDSLSGISSSDGTGRAHGDRYQLPSEDSALQNNAPAVASTEKTSWGLVKSIYR